MKRLKGAQAMVVPLVPVVLVLEPVVVVDPVDEVELLLEPQALSWAQVLTALAQLRVALSQPGQTLAH